MRTVLLYILLPLILLLVVFYWWAQRGNIGPDDLHAEMKLSSPVPHSGDTMSIMTYNIGYLSGMTNNLPVKPDIQLFDDNLEKSRQLIKQWRPDIIGFQEIDYNSSRSYYRNQLDSLSNSYLYAVKSVNWDKRYVPFPYWPPSVHFGKMASGQAILSRFPVINSQRKVLSGPESAPFYYRAFYLDRLIQQVELDIEGSRLIVLNVHLEAFDQQTRETQAREVLSMVDQYVDRYPLILIGDFNARPPFASQLNSEEKTISMFLEHPALASAIDETHYLENEKQHFTFDTTNPVEKLDYIFYTRATITPIEVATVSQAGEISDHYPVYMSFKILSN